MNSIAECWARLATTVRDRIATVMARATPPRERVRSRFFVRPPVQNEDRVEKLLRKWKDAAACEDDGWLGACFDSEELDSGLPGAGLVEVAIRDREMLPDWAGAFLEILAAVATESEPDAEPPANPVASSDRYRTPLGEVIAPLLPAPLAFIHNHLALTGLAASGSGVDQMLEVFARRLLQALTPVLDFELQLARTNQALLSRLAAGPESSLDRSLNGWISRVEQFPVVAYLIGVSYAGWRAWMSEIFDRLASDWPRLTEELLPAAQGCELIGFQGDAGDVHGGGRTVAILTLEGNRKLVYKPKDLRCAAEFIDLVAFLNRSGLDPQLHVRRILLRNSYAWEEFVEHRPCSSVGELERFYVRMGMTIRLLQLVEGRDFWLDNLIAHGEHPVFVDLETVLQPRPIFPGLLPSEEAARRVVAESAIETCAIAMPTPIDIGIGAEDYGALATPRVFITPYKRSLAARPPNGRAPSVEDYFTWTHSEYAPTLEGKPVDPCSYFDHVLTGYKAMQECLEANKTSLVAAEPMIFSGLPVRFIYRDTWTYHKLIRKSLMPALLVDPIQREIMLQQLFRPFISGELSQTLADRHCQIVRTEVASLRALDIPFFLSQTDSESVFTLDGEEVEGYFDGAALDRFLTRLRNLDRFPIDSELDIIRSCFATGRHHVNRDVNRVYVAGPQAPEPEVESSAVDRGWVEEAVAIGDDILSNTVASLGGDLAWLGLVYHPHIDLLSLEVLQADLLTGTCGLAILFSDLFSVTRDERWKTAGCGALASTLKAVDEAAFPSPNNGHSRLSEVLPQFAGGFLGIGAHIYSLNYCANALSAPNLRQAADAMVAGLRTESVVERAGVDVLSGTAGLMLALMPSAGEPDYEHRFRLCCELARNLLNTRERLGRLPASPYPRGGFRTNNLPDATSGLALGLARLIRSDGDRISKEFQPTLDRLLMRASDESEQPQMLPARLLIELEIARLMGADTRGLLGSVDDYLSSDSPATDTVGLLTEFEIGMSSFEITGLERYRQRSLEAARRMRAARISSGSWFPASLAADRHNLSIVWGVVAIARAFLRLHDARYAPSVRLLRQQQSEFASN